MIGLRVSESCFDAPAIVAAVDQATRAVLSRFAAFVRQTARQSIVKAKLPSAAGEPPRSHVGTLRRFIWFGYDARAQSVVIGPVRLGSKSGEALPALEYGGRSTVTFSRGGRRETRVAKYRARPFMQPALQKELPKLPGMWRDAVRR